MTPVVYVIFQSSALADGGLESVTQILGGIRAPRVVVTDKETRFTARWRELGCDVRVWRIPGREGPDRSLSAATRAAMIARYNAGVAALVVTKGARVVHTNDIRAFWAGAIGARAAGAKVVFNVRDVFDEGRPYGPRWRAVHHLANEVVCLSEEMRGTALSRFPPLFPRAPGKANVSVVYSAVDLARMRPLEVEARARLRAEMGIGEDTFEIAYVGVFCEKKNQLEVLRQVAPAVAERLPKAHFTFVGDFRPDADPYARACEEAARDLVAAGRVRFAGFDPRVERRYQASDVVALGSRYEGLPRCMIESMACGTPVVAFDVTSVREFLEQQGCGVAVKRFDYPAFVEGIVRLATSPELRAQMAERCREVAVASFAPDRSVGAYADTYDRLSV